MKTSYKDEKTGYKISVSLGINSMKDFVPGYYVELALPSGGITAHCSSNIAEAIMEAIKKADLLHIKMEE